MDFNEEQREVIYSTEPKIICLASAASGKAIPCDTMIPTPIGMRQANEIKVGDYLFDKEGKPTKVLGVYPQGKKEVYEVTFGDGRKAKCCEEHIWAVNKVTWKNKNDFREMTVKEMLENGLIGSSRRSNFYIPVAKAVEYSQIDYSISPYVIGVFLGDGCCTGEYLTVSSETEEIPNKIKDLIGADEVYKNPTNYNWTFKKNGHLIKTEILPDEVRQLSYNKSIPNSYKYGSIEQRFELIKGLMDTDGCITKDKRKDHTSTATVTYASTSPTMIENVREVLLSLGIVSTIQKDKREDKYTKGVSYQLLINTSNENKYKLFSLKRKEQIALSIKDMKQKRQYDRTSIRDIHSLKYETEMVCFEVDNSEHLYLMNDFIVTHNTKVLTERVRVLLEEKHIAPSQIVAITYTNLAAEEMRRRLGDCANGMFIGTLHSYAGKICTQNNINIQKYLDREEFDKVIARAILIPKEKFPKIKYLLIDECQDFNEQNYDFCRKCPAENVFYVGDDRQCQPAGTKIKLRNGIVKNIEDIEIGDSVVWYDNDKSYLSGINIKHNSIEKKVLKTACRGFCNDNLITIKTEKNHQSKYTPNHITFVKIHQCEYNHAVYLMCDKNNRFRIGKIPFTCTNKSHANPWRDKMYKEGCEKIWILKVFRTDKEARLLETKLSYKYSIPQTCWQLDKVSWTREDLDYIYEGLDTFSSAKDCLKEFNRDYNYPLLDKSMEESSHIHYAKNAVAQIYAANLMPEVMDVITYDENVKHKKVYEKIVSVEYEYITSPIKVYSLEVEGGTYVADEIVTHNCIYAFRGASKDALLEIYNDPTFKKYYLNKNYRNTPEIVNFAENFIWKKDKPISDKSNPMNESGEDVIECSFYEAVQELINSQNWGNWAVLCRTNAQVDTVMEYLESKEVPCISFKKGDVSYDELNELMASDRVKVLTIHSDKGGEHDNVIVVGGKEFNEEERRISYVAATRAKFLLYWCPAIKGTPRKTYKKQTAAKKTFNKVIEF